MHVLLLQGNGESMQPLPLSDDHNRWVHLHSCDVELCTLWIDTQHNHSLSPSITQTHTHALLCIPSTLSNT